MLYRKIQEKIEYFLKNEKNKVLIIEGARQIGKTFIVRETCKKLYKNFIEINMLIDKMNKSEFSNVRSIEDFYFKISGVAGEKLGTLDDTIIFIDEIQEYPELITLLKFLKDDNRYNYIASGSLLGVTLSQITSIPIGTIEIMNMYPLDFEEFLYANNVGREYTDIIKQKLTSKETLDNSDHEKLLDMFKKYLLVGGMPDVINTYLKSYNIYDVRKIQNTIISLYKEDCTKYEKSKKLKIQRLYELIPSNMENKKKRVVLKSIDNKTGKTIDDYQDEFLYLVSSGIAIEVKSVSEPRFPLLQSTIKSLTKFYMNDVGLLSCLLYNNNVSAILDDDISVNLGSVYETAVAQELKTHNTNIYYYDNKKIGEVDYLIDDYNTLSILPIEVKSGRNYYVHSAINNLLNIENYNIKNAIVLSNEREIISEDKVIYMPIYSVLVI